MSTPLALSRCWSTSHGPPSTPRRPRGSAGNGSPCRRQTADAFLWRVPHMDAIGSTRPVRPIRDHMPLEPGLRRRDAPARPASKTRIQTSSSPLAGALHPGHDRPGECWSVPTGGGAIGAARVGRAPALDLVERTAVKCVRLWPAARWGPTASRVGWAGPLLRCRRPTNGALSHFTSTAAPARRRQPLRCVVGSAEAKTTSRPSVMRMARSRCPFGPQPMAHVPASFGNRRSEQTPSRA